jgi:ABC-2 type transport system permease protein
LAARAVFEASTGHPLLALCALAGALACVVGAAAVWSAALDHLMTSSDTTTSRPAFQASDSPSSGPLFGRFLRWLPPTRAGAIAARELRYYWRDPKRRAAIISFVPILLLPAAGLFSGHLQKTYVLGLAGVGYFITVTLDNQFGILGPGYGFQVVTAHDPEADFYGTTLAALVVSLGAVGAVTLVVAAILGGGDSRSVGLSARHLADSARRHGRARGYRSQHLGSCPAGHGAVPELLRHRGRRSGL